MASAETDRIFKRRIAQLKRRLPPANSPAPRWLSSNVVELANDLRVAGANDLDGALDISMLLLEELPEMFVDLEDPLGTLDGAFESLFATTVDLILEHSASESPDIERYGWVLRVFNAWISDETGFLQCLDSLLLNILTTENDDDSLIEISRLYLRDMPLIFPPGAGEKLDSRRNLLLVDRYRVDRLIGEIHARHDRFEYLETVTGGYYRLTGDPVDYVQALSRSGKITEAEVLARKVLESGLVPRPEALRRVYGELISARDGLDADSDVVIAHRNEFVGAPSIETFNNLREAVPAEDWQRVVDTALGELQRAGREPDLVFNLMIDEGLILEADSLVVTQPVAPNVLAAGADRIMDEHTDRAAGWLLVAAHRLMKSARPAAYRKAATWLTTVQRASDATGQTEAFVRVLEDFKKQYGRRKALMRTLDEYGL